MKIALVAQRIEHLPSKQMVVSSNLTRGTRIANESSGSPRLSVMIRKRPDDDY